MADLEIQKLKLEILSLKKTQKRERVTFFVDLIKGLSVIIGILVAINEFIIKDRESENQKSKVTLEYVQKIANEGVVASKDSLKYFLDNLYGLPVDDPREDSLFFAIDKRFDKATMNLSHYYNVLNEGIESGYFDENICIAFLSDEVTASVDLINEIQSKTGKPGDKKHFDYVRFRGMIEFYIKCYNINIMDEEQYKDIPDYDLDKPHPYIVN